MLRELVHCSFSWAVMRRCTTLRALAISTFTLFWRLAALRFIAMLSLFVKKLLVEIFQLS